MPTPSGWFTILLSSVVFALGQFPSVVLGRFTEIDDNIVVEEAVVLGFMGVLLAVVSVLAVRLFSPRSRPQRIHPAAVVAVEGRGEVEVRFQNRFWPPLKLPVATQDFLAHYFPGKPAEDAERLVVNFTISGRTASARYGFNPKRRGIVRFGPLRFRSIDPMGLAKLRWEHPLQTEILVLPPIEDVIPPELSLISKSWQDEVCSQWLGSASNDFLTLREYSHGDDLRHVHWKVTARAGNMMLRQYEHRRDAGISLLLDTRAGAATEADFEKMVGAAASIAVSCRKHRMSLRVFTTSANLEPLDVYDDASLEAVLKMLAQVYPQTETADLDMLFSDLKGSTIALVGSRGNPINDFYWESLGLDALLVSFGSSFKDSFGETSQTPQDSQQFQGLSVQPLERFSDVWNNYFWNTRPGVHEAEHLVMPSWMTGNTETGNATTDSATDGTEDASTGSTLLAEAVIPEAAPAEAVQ